MFFALGTLEADVTSARAATSHAPTVQTLGDLKDQIRTTHIPFRHLETWKIRFIQNTFPSDTCWPERSDSYNTPSLQTLGDLKEQSHTTHLLFGHLVTWKSTVIQHGCHPHSLSFKRSNSHTPTIQTRSNLKSQIYKILPPFRLEVIWSPTLFPQHACHTDCGWSERSHWGNTAAIQALGDARVSTTSHSTPACHSGDVSLKVKFIQVLSLDLVIWKVRFTRQARYSDTCSPEMANWHNAPAVQTCRDPGRVCNSQADVNKLQQRKLLC